MSAPAVIPIPAVSRTTNCEFCHQRPKNGGHRYCGKTCATQAAQVTNNNCNYCHQKPKFGTFEYCGKHCAAQAQKTQTPPVGSQPAPAKQAAPATAKGQNTHKSAKSGVTVAPAVVVPPVQAQVQVQPTQPQSQSWVKKAASQLPKILTSSSSGQSATNAPPGVCAIPGCGVAVHVNPNGFQTSDYCSQKHREEAVDSGLVSPCVMCLTMPQSKSDYFCSRLCREEANNKTQ